MSVFESESFDAVLCMGAFYHLKSKEERRQCIAECLRVLKKGGIFILAYINRNPCSSLSILAATEKYCNADRID